MDQKSVTDETCADFTHQDVQNSKWLKSVPPEDHSNGAEALRGDGDSVSTEEDHFALSNDDMSEFSSSDISLPEVCISSNIELDKEEKKYEVQQAHRIFSEFLTEKHKVIASPFLNPTENQDEIQDDFGGDHRGVNVKQSMCLHRIEEKFTNCEYETITEFVADFRLMLENCYRCHGVDHWQSKQGQKLEKMLEQKLTLLSRELREKTTLAVTSKGRFSFGEERVSSSSTRRRQIRSVKTLIVGGHESVMVQALRMEEQQKAREEKRQRELEKKEAEEMSAKEMDEWEQNLLSQASPHNVETVWELPAIGHFLCLAQNALNLPEIVFFELERCLLMPRCSTLLSKIMSSLLCPPQRRSTLQRRPVLPYRRWEAELRQRVQVWYQSVGSSQDQSACAEQLGLCYQFFNVLGHSSPLEAKAFHMLPFYQRVWLLKGLCDHVYETQKDIQMAVLAQPIHECRESILGYDSKENAYIHFPHFCGADLRIYCQSPCTPPNIPFSSVLVEKVETQYKLEEEMPSVLKNTSDRDHFDEKNVKIDMFEKCKLETSHEVSEVEPYTNSSIKGLKRKNILLEETSETDLKSKKFKLEMGSFCSPLQSDEEHCYSATSPTGFFTGSQPQTLRTSPQDQRPACENDSVPPDQYQCCCEYSEQSSSDHTDKCCAERLNNNILKGEQWRKTKEQHSYTKPEQKRTEPARSNTAIKRKDKMRKHVEGKTLPSKKTEPHAGPYFKLICANLDDLRELINKTEDELDDLESRKKKMNLWQSRREAVKSLHSTLIRLLNELTPWEAKLIKAYQRNRMRLKKEFDVFRSHSEFSDFVREESISASSDDGGESGLLFEQCSQSGPVDPQSILPRGLGGIVKDFFSELSTDNPLTHIHYHQNQPQSTINLNPFPKSTSELNHQSVISSHSFSAQTSTKPLKTLPLLKPNLLHTESRHLKSYTPIPTLLAKSVGNKVTLMKQPADHLETASINGDIKGTLVSTGDTNCFKLNNLSSAPPQNSLHKANVCYTDHKEQNPLVGNPNLNVRFEETESQKSILLHPNIVHNADKKDIVSKQKTKDKIASNSEMNATLSALTNVTGFTIPENRIIVQQVPPSKNTGLIETSLCSGNTPSFLRPLQSAICSASYKRTKYCDVKPSAPQCSLNNITSLPSSLSQSTDSKQELKTVCIRESQSILVTTRGGNTGIVKVQKSTDHTVGLSKSPVITISPQFEALLVSKPSTVFSSNTNDQLDVMSTASTGSTVQMSAETPCISRSQEAKNCSTTTKYQGLTSLGGYTSALNPGKLITTVSGALTAVKNANPSFSAFVTSPSLTAADLISQPRLSQTSGDNGPHIAKLILISSPSHDATKALSTSSSLVMQQSSIAKLPLIPVQSPSPVTKWATTAALEQAMETPFKMDIATNSVTSPSISKKNCVLTSSGTSTDPVKFPCMITTTSPQSTQTFKKGCDTAQRVTSTAQTIVTNSNAIPSVHFHSTSLSSLEHLGISSITMSSQPSNVTSPSKSLSADISNISKFHPTTPQNAPNPISSLSLKHKSLNNLCMSNVSVHSDKTPLSQPVSFAKPQDSFTVLHKSTEVPAKSLTNDNTTITTSATASSIQKQMVINTSTHLTGGTRIVLNNAHFVVPPEGLGRGSHVLIVSGLAPQTPNPCVTTEDTVPSKGASKGQILNQPSMRLPNVTSIKSSFVTYPPAVAFTVQAPGSTITAPRPDSPNTALLVNTTDSKAKSFLQTGDFGRSTEGISRVANFPTSMPQTSTVTNVSSSTRSECLTTTTASLGLSVAQLLNATGTPCSQSSQISEGISAKPIASHILSQHPAVRVESISSSTSTTFMHMGLGNVTVQKPNNAVVHPGSAHAQNNIALSTQSLPPVVSLCGTLPSSGEVVEAGQLNNTAAPSPSFRSTTHCPVIVTNPAMGKHLQHTSSLEMHNPVMSKLLISPNYAVFSTAQCKGKSTMPETGQKMDS